MSTRPTSKLTVVSLCTAVVNAMNNLAGVDGAVVGGETYTKAQMLAPLITYIPLPAQTALAKVAQSKAIAIEKAAEAAARAMLSNVIKPYLQTRFGKKSPELVSFGLTAAKTPTKSAATKAAAVQKSKATHKALGPTTAKQRKAAKGQLPTPPSGKPPQQA